MLYSLVVSAKMNGLNAEDYLIRLFRSPDPVLPYEKNLIHNCSERSVSDLFFFGLLRGFMGRALLILYFAAVRNNISVFICKVACNIRYSIPVKDVRMPYNLIMMQTAIPTIVIFNVFFHIHFRCFNSTIVMKHHRNRYVKNNVQQDNRNDYNNFDKTVFACADGLFFVYITVFFIQYCFIGFAFNLINSMIFHINTSV